MSSIRPTFMVYRSDRLIARLAAMLAMWRFARQIQSPVIVCWPPRKESLYSVLPAEPYQVELIWDVLQFYKSGGHRELIFLESSFRREPAASLGDMNLLDKRVNGFERNFFVGQDTLYIESKPQDYRFSGETDNEISDQLSDLFERLPLAAPVNRALNNAKNKVGDQYVALHVRRGDVPRMLRSSVIDDGAGPMSTLTRSYLQHLMGRTAPVEFYDAPIREHIANGEKIVLFTDEPRIFAEFQTRHGPSQIVDGSQLADSRLFEVQKAMVDFVMLKDAKEIVATTTGYSLFAARLGGSVHRSATCAGPLEVYFRYLFSDILGGIDISPARRQEMIDVIEPIYRPRGRR